MATAGIIARRILVVDDEPMVCDSTKRILAQDGHEVVTASSAAEALATFEKGKFDLVITDYEMPAMKGDALAAAIKALAPEQPVLMITAYVEPLLSSGNALAGVDLMVSKPFTLPELRQAVANLMPKS